MKQQNLSNNNTLYNINIGDGTNTVFFLDNKKETKTVRQEVKNILKNAGKAMGIEIL